MAGPLAGVRILDCTTVVLGPWAAQQLGDLGADVVKIEPPEGDTTRQLGPARNPGMAAFYLGCNRSKRSIVLDLKQDAGRNALFKLAETADVLMHNYRPEPAKRLGVEYEAFEKINPRLVYLATYGYRSAGPMGPKAAYDDIIQAGSGLAALQSVVAGQPRFLPTIVADKTSSNGVVSALLAGAVRARAHGQGPGGRSADVRNPGLVRDGRASLRRDLQAGARDGGLQARAQQGAAALSVEGRLLRAAALHRRSLEGVLRPGRPRPISPADARFTSLANRLKNVEHYYATLAEICATRTNAEWVELLKNSNVPHGPVNTLDDLFVDPQLEATGFWKEVDHPTEGRLRMPDIPPRFSKTKPEVTRLQPRLGEHSVEILREAGFTAAEIDAMLKSGATKTA